MSVLYVQANFLWGFVFFSVAIALGVVAVWKLQGGWRMLVPGMAVAVAAATGFCMMGQYWVDQVRLDEQRMRDRGPHAQLDHADLDRLAREFVKDTPAVAAWVGDSPLAVDLVCFVPSERLPSGRFPPQEAIVSYIVERQGGTERLYLQCARVSGRRWEIIRATRKESQGGRVREVTLWPRSSGRTTKGPLPDAKVP